MTTHAEAINAVRSRFAAAIGIISGPQTPYWFRLMCSNQSENVYWMIKESIASEYAGGGRALSLDGIWSPVSATNDVHGQILAGGGAILYDVTGDAGSEALGNISGMQQRIAQSFTPVSDIFVESITILFGATDGSPVGQVVLRIETDNAGAPSGTLVNTNATKVITPISNTHNIFTFPVAIPLVSSILRVQYDNQSMEKPGKAVPSEIHPIEKMWCRFTVKTGESTQKTIGRQCTERTVGVAFAQLFSQLGEGDGDIAAMAVSIKNLFKRMTYSGVTYLTPSIIPVRRTDEEWQVNVQIPFWFYEIS